MSFKNIMLSFFLASFLSLSPASIADGDIEAGRQKAETCLGCHGIEGYKNTYPTFRVPRLKGQHAKYIISALKAYRSQARSHPTMQAQAGAMSDQDIEDIAAYIGAMK